MTVWCVFLLLLVLTTTTSAFYLDQHHDILAEYENIENDPRTLVYHAQENSLRRSTIVKRSQRNANILYRYCRRNGQGPNFCLKYAIRMIFATGH
ncbi:unnamed protein product [Adineta ricciae]|uniref:Uncharacterized protein n=1 Tax=Adineta ricciae TaxID=249248 RepID=A0A814U2L7_ADIRI|nr:unnamed protein product [Adineta ricciae]CAF1169270.1 unnamed protein product [Adineta ricciae]